MSVFPSGSRTSRGAGCDSIPQDEWDAVSTQFTHHFVVAAVVLDQQMSHHREGPSRHDL